MSEKPKLICYDDDLIRNLISFYGYVATGLKSLSIPFIFIFKELILVQESVYRVLQIAMNFKFLTLINPKVPHIYHITTIAMASRHTPPPFENNLPNTSYIRQQISNKRPISDVPHLECTI